MPDKISISRQVRRINNKLYLAFALMIIILLTGTLGFRLLSDDYNWIDALYMTIITVTTVGFGEVHPAGTELKIFTILLIITSIIIYGFVLSVFTEVIANGSILNHFKRKKMQRKINAMKNHVIICGYGRNGKQAAERLQSYQKEIIIIENHPDIIEEIEETGLPFIKGDATDDNILYKANISQAAHLITALPSDADNLFVVLSARQMNPRMTIISRASNDSSYQKLKVAGADNIIMPDKIGGNHMASLIVTPDLIEFVERLTIEGRNEMNLEEISIDDLPAEYIGKTLKDLDIRKKTGCSVIGLKTPANQYVINPDPSVKLEKGTHLIILGNLEQIQELHKVF